MYIYDFVRNRRKSLGLTQQQLANIADISLSVVKRIESNNPYNPRGRNIYKLAHALQVEPDRLVMDCKWGWEDERSR